MAEYVVTGPVAVLPTKDGSERYMYRGAVVSVGEFTKAGIAHALDCGLLTEAPEPIDVEALAIRASIDQVAAVGAAATQAATDKSAKPTGK